MLNDKEKLLFFSLIFIEVSQKQLSNFRTMRQWDNENHTLSCVTPKQKSVWLTGKQKKAQFKEWGVLKMNIFNWNERSQVKF